MRKRTSLFAAALVVAGALLSWLSVSDLPSESVAREKTPAPSTKSGTQLPQPDIPGTVQTPEGKVELKTVFTPNSSSKTGGGTLRMFVNGQPAGEGKSAAIPSPRSTRLTRTKESLRLLAGLKRCRSS